MNKKTVISFIVVAIVAFGIGWILHTPHYIAGAISPAGTTNKTAHFYSTSMSLTATTGTSTSILNDTGFDWAIQSSVGFCQSLGTSKTVVAGSGLANLIITGATTTSSAPAVPQQTNYGTNLNISTTTTDSNNSTTTEGVITGTSRIVPSGAYYTFFANATNTASCTVGINAINL